MVEPETLALLELGTPDPEPSKKRPSHPLPQPSAASPAPNGSLDGEGVNGAGEGDATSEAATLPWSPRSPSTPQPSAPLADPSEPLTLPGSRAAVPIDPQCVELCPAPPRPPADLIVRYESETGRPPDPPHPAVVGSPGRKWEAATGGSPGRKWEAATGGSPGRKWEAAAGGSPGRKWEAATAGPSCRKWEVAAAGRERVGWSRCPVGCRGGGRGERDGWRAVASMGAALVLFPCLLYGAFTLLPFDAPRLPTLASRLVYTLRCGVFATFPIVLGLLVHGVSLLCFGSPRPFAAPRPEVELHRRYVGQSVQLFVLYFFNLAVLATHLPQDRLKLLPLLAGLFAISRLVYWLTFAMGRSFRGFGFGLTFLPLLAMLGWNLYHMFLVEPERLFTPADPSDLTRAGPRPWG
ncbi:transmembrane protein 79 [Ornithorhynchus anatinus]|uniref:transmembrane protein 79 n=1 Tax=Ornithorhynchus anatinus TaxID=9258 RepID=UPI0010A84627|nr:transmembrane protein 79 [Ornithorhynchus anatinus]